MKWDSDQAVLCSAPLGSHPSQPEINDRYVVVMQIAVPTLLCRSHAPGLQLPACFTILFTARLCLL